MAVPGVRGGLVTGKYQPNPAPAFNAQGGALADSIVEPQSFTAIDFSIATNEKDPQTGLTVPPPTISVDKGKFSGQVEAWSASWNKLYFNQGSPKPNGSRPGLTAATVGHLQPEDPRVRDHVDEPGGRRAVQRFHRVLALAGTFSPAK